MLCTVTSEAYFHSLEAELCSLREMKVMLREGFLPRARSQRRKTRALEPREEG